MPMEDKLKQLRDALLDRGLSLLPPRGTPVSSEVTEEAVLIYEALAATPLPKPPKTGGWTVRTYEVKTPWLDVAAVRRMLGIPEPSADAATPVLGAEGDRLAVLNPGTIRVSVGDGRGVDEAQVGVTPDVDFNTVTKTVTDQITLFAVRGTHRSGATLGTLPGNALGALKDGEVVVCVMPGSMNGRVTFRAGCPIGNILARVGSLLADIADPRPSAGVTTDDLKTPPPVMHFPRASTSAWAARDPGDRWVAGNVLGRLSPEVPAVLNRGRITIETTDGHLALVDVEPRHTFDEVVRCVKLGLRLEIDRLTSTGKDTLFARMASSGDTCVLRRGKVTLRTSGAVETGFYVEPLESLSAVEDRITAKLAALAGIHTPLFGCETVTGRFLTLRDGVLQVGDPLGSTEAIPVVKGASLERVLDQVKEALLKRAGAAVGSVSASEAKVAPDYKGLAALIRVACGPLAPSRFDEVKVTFMAPDVEHGATFTAAQVRAILTGGDPWSVPSVSRKASPAPETIPAGSIGIVYPKIADTAAHDTASFRAGAILKPAVYPSPQDAVPATVALLTSSVLRTGGALVCKTVDGSPWPSDVTLWTFANPPPGCYAHASSAPPKP